MIDDFKKEKSRIRGKFVKRHWKMIMLWVVVGALAAAGALYVFADFAGDAQASGMVPESLGDWSVGHIFKFCLNLIFWELLFIGIPLIIVVIATYALWWNRLPPRERAEYDRAKLFKSSDDSKGSGAIGLFINILFLVKINMDGNWNLPISTWSFDYFIDSILWVLMWLFIIMGIPMAIGGLLYLNHLKNKASRQDTCAEPGKESDKETGPGTTMETDNKSETIKQE